ncbi:NmrA family NAD(P)-binding protein [Streptomyces gelaticus]
MQDYPSGRNRDRHARTRQDRPGHRSHREPGQRNRPPPLAAGWRVRALVRDRSAPAAAELSAAGAEVVRGDLDDRASLDTAMRGVHGAHSVQSANPTEIAQGRNVAAAAGVHTQVSRDIPWERDPQVAKVFTWANETYYDSDLAPLRKVHPGLMSFGAWLDRSGRARLMAQLDTVQ